MSENTWRSGSARRIEDVLSRMNIQFEFEKPFPPYVADIYLPEWHLIIEIDGPQHFAKADATRDARLKEHYNVVVLHLKHDILIGTARDEIIGFIEENADSADKRKAYIYDQPKG